MFNMAVAFYSLAPFLVRDVKSETQGFFHSDGAIWGSGQLIFILILPPNSPDSRHVHGDVTDDLCFSLDKKVLQLGPGDDYGHIRGWAPTSD